MTTWYYRATTTKIPFEDTQDLAVSEGFLCRSAWHKSETRTSRAANTRHVKLGDTLHFYYTGGDEPKVIGSFQIVGPDKHAHPHRFGKCVAGTALFEVVDDAFERKLHALSGREGYVVDPVIQKMTGWILQHRPDLAAPPYVKAPFSRRSTLVRER